MPPTGAPRLRRRITESVGLPQSQSAFTGMGWIFMLSESFPILAMLAFAAGAARTRIGRTWVVILVVLVGYFALKMLFGGCAEAGATPSGACSGRSGSFICGSGR